MSKLGEKTILAIDPGSAKMGLALVRRDPEDALHILWRRIVPADELESFVDEAKTVRAFAMVVIGDGTRSRVTVERIQAHAPGLGVLVIDEENSSLQARERYWEHHPRKGWRRLLPASMQVPPEPVDDFVAVILAERVLLGT